MRRKLFYMVTLVIFILMWGVFGIAAAMPHGETAPPAVLPSANSFNSISATTGPAMIPVTGNAPSEMEVLAFYALIGVGALILILFMLSVANRSTAPYPQQKRSSSGRDSKE